MEKQFCKIIATAGWTFLLLVAPVWVLPAGAQQFSKWSAPVNLGRW